MINLLIAFSVTLKKGENDTKKIKQILSIKSKIIKNNNPSQILKTINHLKKILFLA